MIALVLALGGLAALGWALSGGSGGAAESRATRAVRASVWAFAALVAVEAGLGAIGHLRVAGPVIMGLGLVAGAVAFLGGRGRPARDAPAPFTAADVALATALIAGLLIRLQAGLHPRFFLYDTLSYHLHVPATWLAQGRLQIVPAVFGDPSSAYAPSNLELWFAFLMTPVRSDALASVGQLPFAALGALAIAAAAREAGARREAALGGALVFLLIPEIWQQARTAMTDLGLAALLLAAMPFASRLRRAHQPIATADLLAAAAAVGLAIGTKYAAAPLSLPFVAVLALAAWRKPRPPGRAVAAALLVVLATGGFWFVRNLVVTGNPWYPVATLGLPGLYTRAAMRAWDYHLPIGDIGALGDMLGAAGFGFGAAAVAGFARVRPPVEAALAAAVVALFWIVIPYQESRFLLPAFGLAALAIARAADRPPAALGWGGLGLALIGEAMELPSTDRLALLPIALVGAAAAHGWRRIPLRARRPVGLAATLAGAALVVIGVARDVRHHRTEPSPFRIGAELDEAWTWFGGNVHGARVAYTGTNLAFPLWGADLSNQVAYVNVAGAPGDRLHDFARRLPPGTRTPTPEPAPYRDGASYDVWLRNLRAAGSDVLFVAALEPIVARTVAADAEQFPVERQWADAHPDIFQLRFASDAARVYQIRP